MKAMAPDWPPDYAPRSVHTYTLCNKCEFRPQLYELFLQNVFYLSASWRRRIGSCRRGLRHERERVFTAHYSCIDIDTVDQETILQEKVHVEPSYHLDELTLRDVLSSSHEPLIRCSPVDIDGLHAIGRVLVSQLTRQLRLLGFIQ